MKNFFIQRPHILICIFLIIAIFIVYGQVLTHEFSYYDDELYVTSNHYVQSGLTLENIKWAFTTIHAGNWHPFTWLSHMLDCQLFGLNSGWHHLTNVLIHMANTLLLFFVLWRMTGTLWRSAFVAALFALHPLHVESVAWVAERKDVLSTFFWMLTMWGYVRYVEHSVLNRYLLVLLFFVLGLMAKPMLVTLPFVLLLLDYWPLARFQFGQSFLRLVWEKIPLFLLSAASSIVTLIAQQSWGSTVSLVSYPLDMRFANALYSYVCYLGKMLWPFQLAILYPHPGDLSVWKVASAALLLAAISFVAIRTSKLWPYFIVGWLWYVGTLVPVIGIVKVGSQAMADRYTYVPLIGIFIIITWGISDFIEWRRYQKTTLTIAGAIIISIIMATTWVQVQYWKNSTTLFQHSLDVTTNNSNAHNNLGNSLYLTGKFEEAIIHYREALRINSNNVNAKKNLIMALSKQRKTGESHGQIQEETRYITESFMMHYKLGYLYETNGKFDGAIKEYKKALSIHSGFVPALNGLASVHMKMEEYDMALPLYLKIIEFQPDNYAAYYNLACLYAKQFNMDKAIKSLKMAAKKGFNDWDYLKNDEDLEYISGTDYFRKQTSDQ